MKTPSSLSGSVSGNGICYSSRTFLQTCSMNCHNRIFISLLVFLNLNISFAIFLVQLESFHVHFVHPSNRMSCVLFLFHNPYLNKNLQVTVRSVITDSVMWQLMLVTWCHQNQRSTANCRCRNNTIFNERFFEKTYFNIFGHNLIFEFHIFFRLFGSIQFVDAIFGFSTVE